MLRLSPSTPGEPSSNRISCPRPRGVSAPPPARVSSTFRTPVWNQVPQSSELSTSVPRGWGGPWGDRLAEGAWRGDHREPSPYNPSTSKCSVLNETGRLFGPNVIAHMEMYFLTFLSLQMISPLIAPCATGCHRPCGRHSTSPSAATGDTPLQSARGRLSWGRKLWFPLTLHSPHGLTPSSRSPLRYCSDYEQTNASFLLRWHFTVFLETSVCYNLCLD